MPDRTGQPRCLPAPPHHWPGNIRELKNTVEHDVILTADHKRIIGGYRVTTLEREKSQSLDAAGMTLEEVGRPQIESAHADNDGTTSPPRPSS